MENNSQDNNDKPLVVPYVTAMWSFVPVHDDSTVWLYDRLVETNRLKVSYEVGHLLVNEWRTIAERQGPGRADYYIAGVVRGIQVAASTGVAVDNF